MSNLFGGVELATPISDVDTPTSDVTGRPAAGRRLSRRAARRDSRKSALVADSGPAVSAIFDDDDDDDIEELRLWRGAGDNGVLTFDLVVVGRPDEVFLSRDAIVVETTRFPYALRRDLLRVAARRWKEARRILLRAGGERRRLAESCRPLGNA